MTISLDMPDARPNAHLRDAVAGALRHADDVGQLLSGGHRRWTDALLSEARAHLSGCLNTVELAIGLEIGDSWLARPVEALGPTYCRIAIERHPGLLSPLLLDHLRQRAAAALALRMTLMPPAFPAEEEDAPAAMRATDEVAANAITAFRLSIDPWFHPQILDRPMRADISAEAFCDLVWTAAALLIDGLTERMGVDGATASAPIGRAAQTLIARHDEQAGPFARAAYVAAVIRDENGVERLAGEAALRHDLLLVGALGARRAGMMLDQGLSLLIDGDRDDRAALARLLRLEDAAYVALLETLAPIGEDDEDALLPELLARYRILTPDLATMRLARWRGPAPLAEKLTRIARGRA